MLCSNVYGGHLNNMIIY